MLICPSEACDAPHGAALLPLSASTIQAIARFLRVPMRQSDALCVIARHIHQRCAAFTAEMVPVTDYRSILDAVYLNDPMAYSPAVDMAC